MKKLFTPLFVLFFLQLTASPDTVLVKMCYYTNTLNYDERTFNVYDSINHMNGSYYEYYGNSYQQWFKGVQHLNYYNSNGDTFLIVTQGGNLNNLWYDMSSSYLLFDSSGNISSSYYISCSSGTCDTLGRTEYTYNGLQKIASTTHFNYYQGVWTRSDSTRYYYGGNVGDSTTEFQFDSAGWHQRKYTNFYRDQFGRDSLNLSMGYSFQTLTFDSAARTIYTYDSIQRRNTIVAQDYFANQWDCPNNDEYEEYDFLGRYTHLYSTCCGCGYSEIYYYYSGNTDSIFADMNCMFDHGGSGHCDTCIYMNQPFTTNIESNLRNDLLIYPNPATEILNVSFPNLSNSSEVCIIDLMGKTVLNLSEINTHDRLLRLDLSSLKKGIYFLKINTGNETIIRRIVKV
jgi:hypothetical protein